MEKRFPAESPPGLDFGASWARFWEVLGSIVGAFSEKFAEHWGAFAIKDRFENLPSASLQKERRFPFHVKSGFFGRSVFHPRRFQDAPRRAKTCQDAPRCAQEGPKTAQDASKMTQDAPKRRQDAPGFGKWNQNGAKLAPKSFQMEGYFRKSQNLSDRALAAAGA